MTPTSASPVQPPVLPDQEELIRRLLSDTPLLKDTPDHLLQVVNVLESYGLVLDAYSKNLVDQGEQQMLNPFPVFRFFHEGFNLKRLWTHLMGDRINFEYAEYCQKAMFWHGTGGLDAYLDTPEFAEACQRIIKRKSARDPLLALNNRLYPDFAPEAIRSLTTIYCLGLFWRVMSDIFVDLARRYAIKEVTCVNDVVHHIRDGLVAAAGSPIEYKVTIGGEEIWVLPPKRVSPSWWMWLCPTWRPCSSAVCLSLARCRTTPRRVRLRLIRVSSSTARCMPIPCRAWVLASHRACACPTCSEICLKNSAVGTTPTVAARPMRMCRSASVSRSRCSVSPTQRSQARCRIPSPPKILSSRPLTMPMPRAGQNA